ncbi:MAG: NAD(P)-dependent oxidoreductase [bacterium]
MPCVLITGASGFIGSHLVEEGLKRGYSVFAAIRKTSSRRYLQDPRIQFLELDLSSPVQLSEELSRCKSIGIRFDYIVHNAGTTRARRKDEYRRVNYLFTTFLVKTLQELTLVPGKFLLMSSLAAYGPGDPVSMEPVSEEKEPAPIDSYGRSKLEAERFLQSLPGFPYLILCPTGVYGPREKDYYQFFRTVQKGFEPYIGTTKQRISFIFVKDLARLVFVALESTITGKTWVVSDGEAYTSGDFSAIVKTALQRKTFSFVLPLPVVRSFAVILELLYTPLGKIPLLNREKVAILGSANWQCDPSVIFRDLGFSPDYTLRKGVEETVIWYRQQGWL